jgi:outer membrane protein assembly factor BamB
MFRYLMVGAMAMAMGLGAQGAPAPAWSTWRGGPGRTGVAEPAGVLRTLGNGAALTAAWTSEALPNGYGEQRGQVVGQGSPVVVDGKVYLYVNYPDAASVPDGRFKNPARCWDTVLCLDLATGKSLWRTDLPGKAWRWGCSATVAVGEGKCVVVGSTGDGIALDAATGAEVWRWKNPDGGKTDCTTFTNVIAPFHASAAIADGMTYLASTRLVACDLATGEVRWTATGGRDAFASPTLVRRGDAWIVLASGAGYDAKTGKRLWGGITQGWSTVAVEDDIAAGMSGANLAIYRIGADGATRTAAIPLENGAGCAAIRDGRIYACGLRPVPGGKGMPSVLCADAEGTIRWETPVPGAALGGGQWSFTAPVVGSGVVCILTGQSTLLLLEADTGKLLGDARPVDALKCTAIAVAGDCLVTRGWSGVRCYPAGEAKPEEAAPAR